MVKVDVEDYYEGLFEHAPVSLWKENFSGIKTFMDSLRQSGVTDFAQYLTEHPEEIERNMRRIQVDHVNRETLNLFGAASVEELLANLDKVFRDEMLEHFRAELMSLWSGEMEWSGDGINYRLNGEPINIRLRWRILPQCESTWNCVLVSIEDITALKKAEMRFHHLFTYAPISLWEEDYSEIKREFDRLREQGVADLREHLMADPENVDRFMNMIRVVDVNRKTLALYQAPDKQTLLANLDKVFRDEMRSHFASELMDMWDGRTFYEREGVNYSLTGEPVHVQLALTLMPGSEQTYDWVLVALQDITARKKAEEYLRYLGTHDVMTGLYNRAFFEETLHELESKREDPISFIIADLNNLKPVNDVFGHHTGDKMIRRAAEVLNASVGNKYVTARIGGDEFIVILPHVRMETTKELMERIQSFVAMNNKYYRDPELSISLGAAVSEPGVTLEKVISMADNDMYKNKGLYHRRRKDDFFSRIE